MQGEPGLGQRPGDVTDHGLRRVVVMQRPAVRIGQLRPLARPRIRPAGALARFVGPSDPARRTAHRWGISV